MYYGNPIRGRDWSGTPDEFPQKTQRSTSGKPDPSDARVPPGFLIMELL